MPIARRYAKPLAAGLIFAGLLFLLYLFLVTAPLLRSVGHDAFAYWNVSLPEPYAIPWLEIGSFAYAPPMAYLMDVFGSVEWWVFSFLWLMLLIGSVIWLGGTPVWILAAFAFPPVALELYGGNIHILLAVAVVLGFAHPWTWSFVLLTKPTLGVGLLWFAGRREWRQLGVALGTTGVLVATTVVLAPGLWVEWFETLTAGLGREYAKNEVPVPLWIRLILAAALVVWGARTDRRWTVVVACTLAMPALWFGSFAMLIGVIPLIREDSLFTRYRHVFGWRSSSTVPGGGTRDRLDPAVLP